MFLQALTQLNHVPQFTFFFLKFRDNFFIYLLSLRLISFFFWLTALARILFLADLAFLSLNLSRSVRPALFFFNTMRLDQLLAAQSSSTLLATSSDLTTLVGELKGILMTRGVSWSSLMRHS